MRRVPLRECRCTSGSRSHASAHATRATRRSSSSLSTSRSCACLRPILALKRAALTSLPYRTAVVPPKCSRLGHRPQRIRGRGSRGLPSQMQIMRRQCGAGCCSKSRFKSRTARTTSSWWPAPGSTSRAYAPARTVCHLWRRHRAASALVGVLGRRCAQSAALFVAQSLLQHALSRRGPVHGAVQSPHWRAAPVIAACAPLRVKLRTHRSTVHLETPSQPGSALARRVPEHRRSADA